MTDKTRKLVPWLAMFQITRGVIVEGGCLFTVKMDRLARVNILVESALMTLDILEDALQPPLYQTIECIGPQHRCGKFRLRLAIRSRLRHPLSTIPNLWYLNGPSCINGWLGEPTARVSRGKLTASDRIAHLGLWWPNRNNWE